MPEALTALARATGPAAKLVLFLIICAAVYKLRANTGSSVVMIGLATLVTAVVLIAFSVDALHNAPETFTAMLAIGVLAIIFDAVWRARRPTGTEADHPAAGAF